MDERILTPLNRERLANRVYQAIMRYILRTGAEVGERLPSERNLSQMLGVSRTVVRAALAQLEEDGYVERQVGVGMLLTRRPPSISMDDDGGLSDIEPTLQDLYEARIALEVGAIDWVVRGLTEQDLNRLEELAEQIAARVAAGDPILQEDRAFHNTLIQACHNPVIIQFASIIDQFFDRLSVLQSDMLVSRPRLETLDIRHRMVVMALRARDVEAARQAMRLHFRPWPKEENNLPQ